jgi:hypothetical protein
MPYFQGFPGLILCSIFKFGIADYYMFRESPKEGKA